MRKIAYFLAWVVIINWLFIFSFVGVDIWHHYHGFATDWKRDAGSMGPCVTASIIIAWLRTIYEYGFRN